jgi:hypothetical protein
MADNIDDAGGRVKADLAEKLLRVRPGRVRMRAGGARSMAEEKADDTWDPPVGALYLREMWRGDEMREATLEVIIAPRDVERFCVDTYGIARVHYGETTVYFGRNIDGAKGRECRTGSGDTVRRVLASDDAIRPIVEALRANGVDLAEWLGHIPRLVPSMLPVERDRLARIVGVAP